MDFEKINEKIFEMKLTQQTNFAIEKISNEFLNKVDIEPLVSKAENYKILGEEEAKQALSMSLQARKLKKALETERQKIIKPHLNFQRVINALAKKYTEKLESIENNLQEKLDVWLEAQAPFNVSFANLILEVEDGTLNQKNEWVFEIENFEKIPLEYLTINEKKIKEAVKLGVRTISGIRIFEKQKTTMKIKT